MAVHTVKLEPPIAKHDLQGFGGQFDCDLFTPLGQPDPCTPAQLTALKKAIKPLKLGHSRIFVAQKALRLKKEHDALFDTIKLAQDSGANVNLTWWHGPYYKGVPRPGKGPCKKRTKKEVTGEEGEWPFIGGERMAGFADVIEEARTKKLDCIKFVTIQNEVNAHDIGLKCSVAASQKLYKDLYQILDAELRSRPDPLRREVSLRKTVDFVGGDLVAINRKKVRSSNQGDWLRFMREQMTGPPSRLLNGYSIHVYWGPPGLQGFDFRFLDRRMTTLRKQINDLKLNLPIYVTEYGVKRFQNRTPGKLDGVNVEDTVLAGFEHAWFNALAPQCGCVGLVKWAVYRTDGPKRPFKGWGMICPPKAGFEPLSPTYFVTQLFNALIDVPGWKAAGMWRSPDKLVLVSRFAATSGGDHSLVALNRGPEVTLQLRNLKPSFAYSSVVWNRAGAPTPGKIQRHAPVRSSPNRTASVTVGKQELVAISTRPIPT